MRQLLLYTSIILGLAVYSQIPPILNAGDSICHPKWERRLEVTFHHIRFDTLDNIDVAQLGTLLKLLRSCPTSKLRIDVFTDSRDSDERNLLRSEELGRSIVERLVSQGISVGRLTSTGHGEQNLIIPEDSIAQMSDPVERENAHSMNRRIVAKLME